MILSILIEATENNLRLDKALALKCPEFSRTRLKDLILAGKVLLDGVPLKDPNYLVHTGENFHIENPFSLDETRSKPQGEDITLEVVYEDKHLIVINKPAGLVVHPAPGNYTGTLVNALVHHYGQNLSELEGQRPGIVHRLDKETSGLLVVAKTDQAHQGLAAQFAERLLSRTYWAFVMGVPIPPLGTIHKNIGRSLKNRIKMSVQMNGGREAITHYKNLKKYGASLEIASLVECKLETGRTHQIRVHLASIGHPIIGDILYGTTHAHHPIMKRLLAEQKWPKDRHALHAKTLQFIHPITHKEMSFETDLPPDLQQLQMFLEGYRI